MRHSKETPTRLHHYNYTTRDHAKTFAFYHGLLGFPLVAFWVEREPIPENDGRQTVMGHAFYGLPDGSMLAFMSFADPEFGERVQGTKQPFGVHLALATTRAHQQEIAGKLREQGIFVLEIDHGFCHSIYFDDPNGLNVEYTSDPPNVDEIYSDQAGTARDTMLRYLAGDHTKTNHYYPGHDE